MNYEALRWLLIAVAAVAGIAELYSRKHLFIPVVAGGAVGGILGFFNVGAAGQTVLFFSVAAMVLAYYLLVADNPTYTPAEYEPAAKSELKGEAKPKSSSKYELKNETETGTERP